MITKYGFIYLSPGADPAVHRMVIETGGQTSTIVAVPDPSAAPEVAVGMVEDGVQLIELCGVVGPAGTAKVLEATGAKVPVGAVSYGVESIRSLAALTADQPA